MRGPAPLLEPACDAGLQRSPWCCRAAPICSWIIGGQPPTAIQWLRLRGGGRKLQPKKKARGGGRGGVKRKSAVGNSASYTPGASSMDEQDSEENEGPTAAPAAAPGTKRPLSEFEAIMQAANKDTQVNDEQGDEVGERRTLHYYLADKQAQRQRQ